MDQKSNSKKKFSREQIHQLQDPHVNIIVDNFLGVNWWKKTQTIPIFTIFYNPEDFPGKYVVRLFDGKTPTRLLSVKDTLGKARMTLPPPFRRVGRHPNDDPVIVETWL